MVALSDLHDDLLLRVLYFTPAKEAASTTALARRWRSLWPSSGAVNLDSFPYSSGGHGETSSKGEAMRYAFLRGAVAALAASRAPVRRLSFDLEGQTKQYVRQSDSIYRVLDVVLSNVAARRVEELRVTVVSHGHGSESQVRVPNLSLGSVPFESLRVLDITTCHCLPHSPAVELALPRLEAMRLHRSAVWAEDLQYMIDAAPLLTALQLDEVQVVGSCKRIRCPRVTALVLAGLDWRESPSCRGGMELDTPMLRSFRYKGFIRRFLLKPPATTGIVSVDLHFVADNEHRQRHVDERCRLFWQFVNNFSNVKTLKLRLVNLEHIIVADKRKTAKLYSLGDTLFSNLHHLDLRACYTPGRKAGGVAFATFLHCCPMIRVLGLELSTEDGDPSRSASRVHDILDEEGKQDLCMSVDRFIRREI